MLTVKFDSPCLIRNVRIGKKYVENERKATISRPTKLNGVKIIQRELHIFSHPVRNIFVFHFAFTVYLLSRCNDLFLYVQMKGIKGSFFLSLRGVFNLAFSLRLCWLMWFDYKHSMLYVVGIGRGIHCCWVVVEQLLSPVC